MAARGSGGGRRRVTARLLGWLAAAICCGSGLISAAGPGAPAPALTGEERLGKLLFFDRMLSTPPGQACASCHDPRTGFSSPDSRINRGGSVLFGAVHGRSGFRKAPSAAYAAFAPPRTRSAEDGTYVGGLFWDGRADTLEAQAAQPFVNPVEQNNPGFRVVALRVLGAPYAAQFRAVYGAGAFAPLRDPAGAFRLILRALAAYEASAEVNPFSSKYDAYLAGETPLTPEEAHGLALFGGKAGCGACHPHEPGPDGAPPLFTDFTYDNLGVPRNPANPFYRMPRSINPAGAGFVDRGLGAAVSDPGQDGRFRVPTLRNVDLRPAPGFVKAYMHNGAFKSLEAVVHFYNARDLGGFPPPEIPEHVNREELGNLGLTPTEESDLVAFLRTLNDGFTPPRPHAAPGR